MKGTKPEGMSDKNDSRQVRRRKIRIHFFNMISNHPAFGSARRGMRRYWAKKGRLQPQ
jgi:hypothetical protein